tara:strand:- start:288 stop:473 length:186 start_codon:yes stop_codon:yes gene_type:complete
MGRLTEAGFLMKFYEKWKNKQLSKTAKELLKDNPQLEKDLKKIDAIGKDIVDLYRKGKRFY